MMRRAAIVVALLLAAAAGGETVTAIGGVEIEGTLESLDREGRLRVAAAAGEAVEVAAADVIAVDFRRAPLAEERAGPLEVLFLNGDRLRAEIAEAAPAPAPGGDLDRALETAQHLTLKSALVGSLRVRTEELLGFVHHARAGELGKTPGFVARETAGRGGDWVWLANGDVQQGRIEGFMRNAHGKVDVFVAAEGRRYQVGVAGVVAARLQAIVPPEKAIPPGLAAVVTLVDGSILSGPLEGCTRTTLRLRVGGQPLEIAKDAVAGLRFRHGRLVYLSPRMASDGEPLEASDFLDLLPVAATNVPFLSRPFVPRKDRSYDGNALTLGSRVFRRGIGTHARSELTYRLDGRFARFEAFIGIDAEVGRHGDAVFRVRVDGVERLTDGRMRGGELPRRVRIPLDHAREMTLIVDYGEDLDIGDHADWADACVIRGTK